jgi:hypothetical protein
MMHEESTEEFNFDRKQILTQQGIPVWVIEKRDLYNIFNNKVLLFFDKNNSRFFEANFNVLSHGDPETNGPLACDNYESLVPLIDYMFSTFRVSGVCPSNTTNCSGYCSDIMKDVLNCGECGNICSNGSTCKNGECECPSGEVDCGDNCTDIMKDVKNCGGCGNLCPNGATCKYGKCVCPLGQKCACPTGLTNCSGYCRNISKDVNNCGKCGFVCGNPFQMYCYKGSCKQ